jgi:hypothetical protein
VNVDVVAVLVVVEVEVLSVVVTVEIIAEKASTSITYCPGGTFPTVKLAFTNPVPSLITQAAVPAKIGSTRLLDPLTRTQVVSEGRNPVPLTSTCVPGASVPGLRPIDGPVTM